MVFVLAGYATSAVEQDLDAKVIHYRSLNFANFTKRTYQTYLTSYMSFCARMGYTAFPVDNLVLCRYVAHLSGRLRAVSIPKYLAILRIVHMEMGLTNPLSDNWTLKSLLKGIQHEKGLEPKRKLPITPDILLKIQKQLNLSCPVDCAFWAACLVAFFGVFQKSQPIACISVKNGSLFLKK